MNDYDNWKLHTGEPDYCACESCEEKTDAQEIIEVSSGDLICQRCAEKYYVQCTQCNQYRTDDEFTYCHDDGHCDNCIDIAVDKLMDRD